MFENLTERLNNVFTQLRRRGKLSAADVDIAMREVRLALLESDVKYGVVKDFITRVRERAVGAEVTKALNPAQQVIKIVNVDLINTLGNPERHNLSGPRQGIPVMHALTGGPDVQAWVEKGVRLILQRADSALFARAHRTFLESMSHIRKLKVI